MAIFGPFRGVLTPKKACAQRFFTLYDPPTSCPRGFESKKSKKNAKMIFTPLNWAFQNSVDFRIINLLGFMLIYRYRLLLLPNLPSPSSVPPVWPLQRTTRARKRPRIVLLWNIFSSDRSLRFANVSLSLCHSVTLWAFVGMSAKLHNNTEYLIPADSK